MTGTEPSLVALPAHTVASSGRRLLYPSAILTWLAAVVLGFSVLIRYSTTPGREEGRPPGAWPVESRLALEPGKATLLLFAHPECPCTRASVSELARLMAREGNRVGGRVVVLRPADRDWDDAAIWERSRSIPGVTVFRDVDGIEAARFHVSTSGLAILYDVHGRRLFSGGITASRGHEGDSFGQQRVVSLLHTGRADRDDAPVFGCALMARADGR